MTVRFARRLALAVALAAGCAGATWPAAAQNYNRPPIDEPDDAPSERDAGLAPRIDRLERQIRNMTGTIEELQHSVRVLEEQLRTARAAPPPAAPSAGERRGDAFDPAGGASVAGAPRPLGQTTASAPLTPAPRAAATSPAHDIGAPMDVTPPALKAQRDQQPAVLLAPEAAPTPPTVKDEYDEAVALMRAGQYENAERSLTVFLAKNSKSKYAPAATYGLGESFYLRGRHREAAEKFLEISTKYPQSAQAPEAMLRLGQSLASLGAKEQACASFAEIGTKYPGSAARIREAAQRESKKLQCS